MLWVLLLPAIVALASMVLAWTSCIVYHLPFMAATRMRRAAPPPETRRVVTEEPERAR